jgi:hypothetical protein
MTTQIIRLKMLSPALKLRVAPRVPAKLTGDNGVAVSSDGGGGFVIGLGGGGRIGNVSTDGNPNLAGQLVTFVDAHNIAGVGIQASEFLTSAIEFTMDGANSPIPLGFRGIMELPFDCKIVRATLMANAAGNLVMDVFKTTAAAPTGGASILAADPPTLAGAQFSRDTALTGWNVNLNRDDALAFYVLSSSVVQATLSLLVTRF